MTTLKTPGPTLGVVGGGQLGRMMAEAAAPLGVELVVLDPTPDCPAALVARDQIVADFDDEAAVYELAERADALTFEIELADPDLLAAVEEETDVVVHPSPATLRTIQDKLVQNRRLAERGIPVAPFRAVATAADVRDSMEAFDGPVMLKARTGGYDGRGNLPVHDPDDAAPAIEAIGGDALAESFVEFEREVSVIGVVGDGERDAFEVSENVHEEEILRETVVPARTSQAVRDRAREVARDVLDVLDGRGVYGIELFETPEGEILVNEIAPRPHNSGHWTIEGALTSQFEQHVRAVLGWPLGATDTRSPTVVANLLGDVDETRPAALHGIENVLSADGVSMHWYGKRDVRPLRKMGHLAAVGGADAHPTELLESTRELRDTLTFRQ